MGDHARTPPAVGKFHLACDASLLYSYSFPNTTMGRRQHVGHNVGMAHQDCHTQAEGRVAVHKDTGGWGALDRCAQWPSTRGAQRHCGTPRLPHPSRGSCRCGPLRGVHDRASMRYGVEVRICGCRRRFHDLALVRASCPLGRRADGSSSFRALGARKVHGGPKLVALPATEL
jgi:hypothetical protein